MLARATAFDPVLARELERGLGGLGAAAQDVGAVHAVRSRDQLRGELLNGFIREGGATDVGESARLARHGLADLAHAMADAGHKRAAHGVEVSLSGVVLDPAPLAAHGQRKIAREVPIEDR